jgi:hypothetical protein
VPLSYGEKSQLETKSAAYRAMSPRASVPPRNSSRISFSRSSFIFPPCRLGVVFLHEKGLENQFGLRRRNSSGTNTNQEV